MNPANRFERVTIEPGDDEPVGSGIRTEYYVDATRSILAKNDSPDVPFTFSVNPYRGCEHGCIYCYARPTHEYLGFSAGLDFESKIMVKPEAPNLLEEAFRRKSWKPQPVALSGNTDCYQPVERRLRLTRRCLEVFLRFRNPVSMITKGSLVTRDLDLLRRLAALNLVAVQFSITTLDPELASAMEPRAASPGRRLDALGQLAEAGIPTGVSVAPVIPGLTDEEVPAILREAAARGARWAGYILVRLPYGVKELFDEWLAAKVPLRRKKVLGRLRDVRGGELSDSRFGSRKVGEGPIAGNIRAMFDLASRRFGLNREPAVLATHHFIRRSEPLFD